MKIIDLLNKIANGEEVPKKIHYNCVPLYWCEPCKIYETMTDDELCGKDLYTLLDNLNDEVEILEEEKKIPEKLNVIAYEKCIHEVTHKEKQLALEIRETQIAFNEIIDYLDYLKNKGE